MIFLSLRKALARLQTSSECKDVQSKSAPALSEKTRLLHRLNCIHLDEDEANWLQAYLTIILENRNSQKTSELASTTQSGCIVLEMSEEEHQKFASYVGGNSHCLFRAIVENDNSQTQTQKLAIVGEHGLRLFRVLVQRRNRSN
ncbi:MAG TPA: hypothetical protein V6C90_27345 [Coleofasciculaceae cyanobacterium]|jgi:hypothetical protein